MNPNVYFSKTILIIFDKITTMREQVQRIVQRVSMVKATGIADPSPSLWNIYDY